MGRRGPPAISGFALVDKPIGMSSHDAVAVARRRLSERAIGHTGTLDPLASGLLVLVIGRATRLARFVEATEKRYLASVSLGRATTTFDAEGETSAEAPVPALDPAAIESALASLVGPLVQQVPLYSAVKVGGERLYRRARRGEVVEAPTREVEIGALRLLGVDGPRLEVEALVSRGTYIRALAVQIGAALGVPAHLAGLRRVAVGAHRVEDAVVPDALEAARVRPLEAAVEHLEGLTLPAEAVVEVEHGRKLGPERVTGPRRVLRLVDAAGRLLAVAEAGEHEGNYGFDYHCVLVGRG